MAIVAAQLTGGALAPANPTGTALSSQAGRPFGMTRAEEESAKRGEMEALLTAATAEAFAKAMQRARDSTPEHVKHNMSLSARRYAHLSQGILTDQSPHLDETVLRHVARRNPVLLAFIQTICTKAQDHFRRPANERAIGMRIALKDRSKKMTSAAQRQADYIEKVLRKGGLPSENPKTRQTAVWDGHYKRRGDNLITTVRKLLCDLLVLDRMFVTVEPSAQKDIQGKPRHPIMFWSAEDAALIRLTDPDDYKPKIRNGNNGADDITGRCEYIMLDPMSTSWNCMREYTWQDGQMTVRNARTEFEAFGYGKSCIEMAIDALMGVTHANKSNLEWFTDNHIPTGILHLVGSYTAQAVESIRNVFRQEVGLPGKYYGMPILASKAEPGASVNWVPFIDRSRQDMNFRAYIEFSAALGAAIFEMSPAEINFPDFGGPKQVMNEADPESTITYSNDKGTVPRVLFLADFFTETVVDRIDPDFECFIQGLDPRWYGEIGAALDVDQKRLAMGWTAVDIARANDQPEPYDPKDVKLWRQVEKELEDQYFAGAADRRQACIEAYEERGGECGNWPYAPAGNAGAMQIYMEDHYAEQQGTREQMDAEGASERDMQRNEESAEAQGVRDQMGNQVAGEDERAAADDQAARDLQAQQDATDLQDKNDGMMRIPAVDDGSQLTRPVRKGLAPAAKPVGTVTRRVGRDDL